MKPLRAGASTRFVAAAALFVLVAGFADLLAQRRGGFGGPGRFPGVGAEDIAVQNPKYDGRFAFARLKYDSGPGGYYYYGLPAWAHGYVSVRGGERAERNLMKIMNEVSYLGADDQHFNTLALDDPEVFKYPLIYIIEVSWWAMTDKEGEALRAYLAKGGFVIVDDFKATGDFGSDGWEVFAQNMRRALPDAKFVDMTPSDPIFHSFFEINSLANFPQAYNAGAPVFRGLYEDNDPTKRLQMIVNYNTDISQFWEWSGRGLRPFDETNEAYKLGVNYIMYGMTH
jgi:hypothetical protein